MVTIRALWPRLNCGSPRLRPAFPAKALLRWCLGLLWVAALSSCTRLPTIEPAEFAPGISYTNYRVAASPAGHLRHGVPGGQKAFSIHVVRVDRSNPQWTFHSTHAQGTVLSLSPLSEQVQTLKPELGTPVAAVNGDFFQRERGYGGDPRGLEILDGELISGPSGGLSFWIDNAGKPHATNVISRFEVTWPDGETIPFGLNEELDTNAPVVLYTPTFGLTTCATKGIELILERHGSGPWLPLRAGQTYTARVREVRPAGDSAFDPDVMVLALNPLGILSVRPVAPGAVLTLSTETVPDLRGLRMAISGGPLLVHNGREQKFKVPVSVNPLPFRVRSVAEQHPRTAIGWDAGRFYLVEVDGRQEHLSAGMILQQLARYMVRLGCREALNLDGGGSATLWWDGEVRNSPSDKHERAIANALILVRKPQQPAPSRAEP